MLAVYALRRPAALRVPGLVCRTTASSASLWAAPRPTTTWARAPSPIRPLLPSKRSTSTAVAATALPPPPLPPPKDYDGMPRYPNATPGGVLRSMDYIGTVAFAMSGCTTAALTGMDLLGCVLVGTITSLGGGTVRDLLIGNSPVFWVEEYEYLLICIVVAAVTFAYLLNLGKTDEPALLWWADTLGLAAFCVIGAQNGLRKGLHGVVCAACGMFTGCFGGVIRDVLCHRPVRILHSHAEIYASTALAGAAVYVLAKRAGLTLVYRIATGFSTAFALRYAASTLNLRLPVLPEGIRFSN
jgi:uncharacterized membrane protein YeiH